MGETKERPPRIVGTLRLRSPTYRPRSRRRSHPPRAAAPTPDPYARRTADLAMLREQFPTVFDADHPRPLAIGVREPLAKLLSHRRAGVLLGWWCRRPEYIAAVAAGGARFNLDGSPAGEISEQHRQSTHAPSSC
jgi:hypothetical protein